jgi:hypothetical protein
VAKKGKSKITLLRIILFLIVLVGAFMIWKVSPALIPHKAWQKYATNEYQVELPYGWQKSNEFVGELRYGDQPYHSPFTEGGGKFKLSIETTLPQGVSVEGDDRQTFADTLATLQGKLSPTPTPIPDEQHPTKTDIYRYEQIMIGGEPGYIKYTSSVQYPEDPNYREAYVMHKGVLFRIYQPSYFNKPDDNYQSPDNYKNREEMDTIWHHALTTFTFKN